MPGLITGGKGGSERQKNRRKNIENNGGFEK